MKQGKRTKSYALRIFTFGYRRWKTIACRGIPIFCAGDLYFLKSQSYLEGRARRGRASTRRIARAGICLLWFSILAQEVSQQPLAWQIAAEMGDSVGKAGQARQDEMDRGTNEEGEEKKRSIVWNVRGCSLAMQSQCQHWYCCEFISFTSITSVGNHFWLIHNCVAVLHLLQA